MQCGLDDHDSQPCRKQRLTDQTPVSMTLRDVLQNPDVFEDPNEWRPDRWLTEDKDKLDEMNRSFVPFGRGSRMCLGIK